VFPGGACLAGSDDPANYGNYQQTQKQSKPTHATKLEYSNVVPRSMEIIHFGAEIFRYVCCTSGNCRIQSREFSPRILSGKVTSRPVPRKRVDLYGRPNHVRLCQTPSEQTRAQQFA
jgi:hypothetical protein